MKRSTSLAVALVTATLSGCSFIPSSYVGVDVKEGVRIHDIEISSIQEPIKNLSIKFSNISDSTVGKVIIGVVPYDGKGNIIFDQINQKSQAWLHLAGPYHVGFNTEGILGNDAYFSSVWHGADIRCVRINQLEIYDAHENAVAVYKNEEVERVTPGTLYCVG